MTTGTARLHLLLEEGPCPPRRAIAYRLVVIAAVVAASGISLLDTQAGFWESRLAVAAAFHGLLGVMALDYALRLAAAGGGWRRYALSPAGLLDLLAFLPSLAAWSMDAPADVETVLAVVRLFKLARYSPALETLGTVVLAELRPLGSALLIMVLLAVTASAVLYFVERDVNVGFVSVPQAMWWSIVTLVTLGYGDVVPITALGKVAGAVVAILGLCMFALPASILASGFSEEMRRRNFITTWHLVAKVPFFAGLQANQIAEIAALLKLHRAARGEVLVNEGELGEAMYFIVDGQAEVLSPAGTFTLMPGDFFGEIALVERRPRTATVRAATRGQYLVLDARDFSRFVASYPDLLAGIRATALARLKTHALTPAEPS